MKLYRYRCDECGREFWDEHNWDDNEEHLCQGCTKELYDAEEESEDELPWSCYDCEYKIAYPVRFGCAKANGRNIRNDPLWKRPDWCPLEESED